MRVSVSTRAVFSSNLLRTWRWVCIASTCLCGRAGIDFLETVSPRVCLGASTFRSIEISWFASFLCVRLVASVPSALLILFNHGACFPLGSSVSLPCPGPCRLLHLLAPQLPPGVPFPRRLPNLLFPSVVLPLLVAGTVLFHLALIIAPSLAVVGVPLAQ